MILTALAAEYVTSNTMLTLIIYTIKNLNRLFLRSSHLKTFFHPHDFASLVFRVVMYTENPCLCMNITW